MPDLEEELLVCTVLVKANSTLITATLIVGGTEPIILCTGNSVRVSKFLAKNIVDISKENLIQSA